MLGGFAFSEFSSDRRNVEKIKSKKKGNVRLLRWLSNWNRREPKSISWNHHRVVVQNWHGTGRHVQSVHINIEINVFRNANGQMGGWRIWHRFIKQTLRWALEAVEWKPYRVFWSLSPQIVRSVDQTRFIHLVCPCRSEGQNPKERCKCAENSWRLIIIEDWEMFLILFPFPHL